jgi:hypothetical protein
LETGPLPSLIPLTLNNILDPVGNTLTSRFVEGALMSISSQDIGNGVDDPMEPGSLATEGLELEVVAGGSDLWGTADGMHYVHVTHEGGFDARVRVTELRAASRSSKAGLNVRESLDANARNVSLVITPEGPIQAGSMGEEGENDVQMNYRGETGGPTNSWGGDPGNGLPSAWLRLERQVTPEGDTWTAYRSSNGKDWRKLGDLRIEQSFPDSVWVGIAATSNNNAEGMTTTAVFQAFEVRDLPGASEPMEPAQLFISNIHDGTVAISWTESGSLQKYYRIEGPCETVAGAVSPHIESIRENCFFRVVR